MRDTMLGVLQFAIVLTLFASVPAWASGGPENLLVVVNDESPESLDIAHYYRFKRDIPAACFCHLRLKPVFELPRDEFDAGGGSLQDYINQVSLVSDTDHFEGTGGAVTLMTLHAAKGLEFPVVFMIGCEDGIMPIRRDGGAGHWRLP